MFRSLHLLEFWWGDRDGRSHRIIARPILMEDGSVGGGSVTAVAPGPPRK